MKQYIVLFIIVDSDKDVITVNYNTTPQVFIRKNQIAFRREVNLKPQESLSSLEKTCNASLYLPLNLSTEARDVNV
jgi:hypothetical protein